MRSFFLVVELVKQSEIGLSDIFFNSSNAWIDVLTDASGDSSLRLIESSGPSLDVSKACSIEILDRLIL